MTTDRVVDVAVIGGGPGGLAAASRQRATVSA